MRSIAFITLALIGLVMPALAQDRTPPATDLRAYAPPIDWTPRQTPLQDRDFDGLATDRVDAPRSGDSSSAERH